ncbi:hypothetical protein COE42_02590 [Bacillus cereus]|uniref:hypothetical protein n=1 Tax=Bacillus thuringiensis TaxID=1428 RepID=UPI000BF639D1|nr:hypothetical protein CN336_29795 [Bacillus cereus]PFL29269.1 hypothetical protein COJ16_28000 [Bacillus cereus]PFO84778.1 hypothetical protein COJ89_28565 [Bacillus cereus]PFR81988.1 hypothetical protein COK42_23995 [Bacillus cereus]PGN51834.1 hypothetical protein CN962_00110 [Bacillus cereus]
MVVSYQLLLINIDITLTIYDSKVENIHTDRVLDSTSIKGLFSIVKFTALTAEDIILENILIVIKNNESLFITYDLKIAIV